MPASTLLAKKSTTLLIVAMLSALAAGHFGSWIIDWLRGNTVRASVSECFVAYGWNETRYAKCDGNWHHAVDQGGANVSYVASGPVLGVAVDPLAQAQREDGLLPGDYPGEYFARLNGSGAVVIPGYHVVLGPLFLLLAIAGTTLGVMELRRRSQFRLPAQTSIAIWNEGDASSTR
jgi:hypothetical protein